jgi:MFS family permease
MREYGDIAGASYLVPSLLTVPALCIALFAVAAGFLGDKLGHRRVLIAALCFYGLTGVAPVLLTNFYPILASRALLGLCEAAIITLSATLIGDYFRGSDRDRWLGFIATTASLSAVVFAGISGVLGDAMGWRGPVLVYGLAVLFIPAMLLLTWEPEPRQSETSTETEAFPWRHMAGVVATTLAGGILFYSVTVQQGMALASLGIERPSSIGFLSALTSLGVPIGTLVFVRLSHLRTAALLAGEFLLFGLAFLGISQATSYEWFAIAAFAGLLAAGMLLPTLITWTMRGLSHSVRGRGTGMFQSTFALGQFASGLVIPALAQNVTGSVLGAFGLLGIVALGIAIIAAVFRTIKPTQEID